jgi:hypothetical protein
MAGEIMKFNKEEFKCAFLLSLVIFAVFAVIAGAIIVSVVNF